MNPLALALAGRREDNAAHGGQVAHISAAEAELLKSMGGAASINPVTGLPEYYVSAGHGGGQSPGVAATGQAPPGIGVGSGGPFGFTVGMGGYGGHGLGTGGRGSANAFGFGPAAAAVATALGQAASAAASSAASAAPGPMGITSQGVAQGLAALGLGTGSSAPGSTGTGSGVTSIGEGAVAADGGLGVVASLGEGQGNYGQSMGNSPGLGSGGFGIVTTTDGIPVTTTDGVPVMHGNLSGRVANTAIIPSDVTTADAFTNLGDSVSMLGDLGIPPISPTPPSLFSMPAAILGFLGQMASAQTAQNVANTRGAIALAGPGMGAPSAAFGGNPNTGTGHPMGLTYGGYSPPTTSGINRLLQSVTPAPIEPEPVVSAAPVSTPVAPVTTLLQTDPREEGFSPSIQEIRRIFFESLA